MRSGTWRSWFFSVRYISTVPLYSAISFLKMSVNLSNTFLIQSAVTYSAPMANGTLCRSSSHSSSGTGTCTCSRASSSSGRSVSCLKNDTAIWFRNRADGLIVSGAAFSPDSYRTGKPPSSIQTAFSSPSDTSGRKPSGVNRNDRFLSIALLLTYLFLLFGSLSSHIILF